MQKILLTIPFFLIACTPAQSGPGYQLTSKKLENGNYEIRVVGEQGISKKKLQEASDKENKTLCDGPFLPRRHRVEVTSLIDDKPGSYTLLTEAQCFTAEDLKDYEKSVVDAKKKHKS